jgi:cytochrome c-type biogenesis protein CcmH/NrfG
MGWFAIIGFALLTGLGLGFFLRKDKGALQFLAAALLLALAGYSWQGRPGFAGSPRAAAARQVPETEFAMLREDLLGRFDRAWTWTNMSESFRRRGDTYQAAGVLATAVRRNPRDAKLWIAYGYALVVHGDGLMSPAAQLAFNRAAALAPGHPAPAFFYACALAQGGNYDEAERIWRELQPGLPAASPYRPLVAERLEAIGRARAAGQIPPR